MSTDTNLADQFLALHVPGEPLLIPNPWDVGSARVLTSLGYRALATTSSGYAMTLGRLDGTVTREQMLGHSAKLVAAVEIPISADLENCYADDPDGAAETVRAAAATGLAGCSIEDWSGEAIYDLDAATDRVRAAAEAAHGGTRIVLTARAENYLHDRADLAGTIARLQAYAEAGADVLYAPGLREIADIRAVVEAVGKPVNVLATPFAPPVAELADAGVARISVGGAFAFAALGGLIDAATELRDHGTYSYWQQAGPGAMKAREVFD